MLGRFLYLLDFWGFCLFWCHHRSCNNFKIVLFLLWSWLCGNFLCFWWCLSNYRNRLFWSWNEVFFVKIKFTCFDTNMFFYLLEDFWFFNFLLNWSCSFFDWGWLDILNWCCLWFTWGWWIVDRVTQSFKWVFLLNLLFSDKIKSFLDSEITCRLPDLLDNWGLVFWAFLLLVGFFVFETFHKVKGLLNCHLLCTLRWWIRCWFMFSNLSDLFFFN